MRSFGECDFMPSNCRECGSSHVVPIVDGYLDTERHILSLQRKIHHRGCLANTKGDPLWACADCGEKILEERWTWNDANEEVMRVYSASVDEAFQSYREVSEDEYAVLRGNLLLRALLRRKFSKDFVKMTFVRDDKGIGFHIVTCTSESKDVESHEIYDADRYECLLAAVKACREGFLCRVGRDEVRFSVSAVVGEIRVRRP